MITLTYNGATTVLPEDLAWTNEYSWSPVTQKVSPSITGSLIVDVGVLSAGRQIELTGDRDRAWMTRGVADQLRAIAQVGGASMTLLLRGVSRTVMFDHERGAFEAQPLPLEDYSDPDDGDRVIPRLRFIEI